MAAPRSCWLCYSRRKSCDKSLPYCVRCENFGAADICSYRPEPGFEYPNASRIVESLDKFEDLLATADFDKKRSRRTACDACRKDKKTCQVGNGVECKRCLQRGDPCIYTDDGGGEEPDWASSSRVVVRTTKKTGGRRSTKKREASPTTSDIRSAHTSGELTETSSRKRSKSSLADFMTDGFSWPDFDPSHLAASSSSFAGLSVPTSSSAAVVPRPIPDESTEVLQDWELNTFLIDRFFTESDINMRLLSRARFYSMAAPPALLVASILLITPCMIGGRPTEGSKSRETALARLAQQELGALLSRQPISVDTPSMAALANLTLWALFVGRPALARSFFKLCTQLWRPPNPLEMPPTTSRMDWLAFWETHRMQQFVVRTLWVSANLTRDIASTPELDIDLTLNFKANPSMRTWDAAQHEGFDPATAELPPLISESLQFLKYPSTDPRRAEYLVMYAQLLPRVMALPFWTNIVMRNRVDLFLAACRQAGLESPVALPLHDSIDLVPALRDLIVMRNEIDVTRRQIRSAFPPAIEVALRKCDARALISLNADWHGNWYYAFNTALSFPALSMLRMELYTALGTYMAGDFGALLANFESLADPFSSGALFAELLADAVTYTRILEGWISANPLLEHHVVSNVPIVFLICCLHAAFRRKFRRSLQADPNNATIAGGSMDLLNHIDHDIEVCLNVLRAYGAKSPSLTRLYNLGVKMVSEQADITPLEVQEARFLKDTEDAPRGGDELSDLLSVYLPFVLRTR